MHVNILEVVARWLLVLVGAKASQSFVGDEGSYLPIFDSGHYYVHPQIKFKIVDEHGITDVPLDNHLLGCEGRHLPQILEQHNVLSFFTVLRLCDEDGISVVLLVLVE